MDAELLGLYMEEVRRASEGIRTAATVMLAQAQDLNAQVTRLTAMVESEGWEGEGRVLRVPYHSQWERDALRYRKDCGPACVEMVGGYWRPGVETTTDAIMEHITLGTDRGTYIRELQAAAREIYGVVLERFDGMEWGELLDWVGMGQPVIALVNYGLFWTRMDRGYRSGHWVVVVGRDVVDYQGERVERVIMHDPNFYTETMMAQGAFFPVVKAHFMEMWDGARQNGNPARMGLVSRVSY